MPAFFVSYESNFVCVFVYIYILYISAISPVNSVLHFATNKADGKQEMNCMSLQASVNVFRCSR